MQTDTQPIFAGEVMLRRWSESSTQGVQVTFALAESAELDRFKGLEGKRFMAVLVQIGDDERPAEPTTKERIGPYCYQAVKWCGDKDFQGWIARKAGAPDDPSGAMAKELVCGYCNVSSRKDLDGCNEAQKLWHEHIAGPYRKWLMQGGLE